LTAASSIGVLADGDNHPREWRSRVRVLTSLNHRMVWFWLLLYAHKHRSILGAAGHIILTPANQLIEMGAQNMVTVQSGLELATFRSLAQRAYQLH
jgi:hypothetical protein